MIEIKRSIFTLIFLILIILIGCVLKASPTSLREIYEAPLEVSNTTEMNIGHASSINDPMIYKSITNRENIERAIYYLSSFKLIKMNSSSFKKFSNLEAYQLTLKNEKGEVFSACIRGNKYLFLSDENGEVETYSLLKDTFNLYYLESLYKCGN